MSKSAREYVPDALTEFVKDSTALQESGRVLYWVGETPGKKACVDVLREAGYRVLEEVKCEKYLKDQLTQELPHILLLDADSLREESLKLVRQLKANPLTYTMPLTIVLGKRDAKQEIDALESGADDYIATPVDIKVLRSRLSAILKRHYRLQISNPLTGLPGTVYIEEKVTKRIENSERFAFCYSDLDNFKAFNDKYSYARGDNAIRIIANILSESVAIFGGSKDFVGHIGGDDFVVICERERVEAICDYITETFDVLIPYQYDVADRQAGYIEAKNRQHQLVRYPIMTVSVGIVTNGRHRHLHSFLEVSELATEMKLYAKTFSQRGTPRQSSYRIDKRSDRD